MTTATLTSKGQITIPADIRHRLGVETGDRLEFVELAEGGFAIKPANDDVRSLKGLLKRPVKPVSIDPGNRSSTGQNPFTLRQAQGERILTCSPIG